MAGKNTAVFGLYRNRMAVENAVDSLKLAGFRNTDISVLFPENAGTKDFAVEKGTKAPEGATAGAGTGAVVCGALGWLAGIGALAIPGVGPFIAAGPIVAALAGVGAGSVVGGITGALIGTRRLYQFAHRNKAIAMRGSAYTHSEAVLTSLPNLVTINSALEVDLTGQVNAEQSGSSYMGGTGGQLDYVRDGSRSPGGHSITMVITSPSAGRKVGATL